MYVYAEHTLSAMMAPWRHLEKPVPAEGSGPSQTARHGESSAGGLAGKRIKIADWPDPARGDRRVTRSATRYRAADNSTGRLESHKSMLYFRRKEASNGCLLNNEKKFR